MPRICRLVKAHAVGAGGGTNAPGLVVGVEPKFVDQAGRVIVEVGEALDSGLLQRN